MTQDIELPVIFTPRQLEALHELARQRNDVRALDGALDPADHNLERKLLEYCSTARRIGRHE